MDQRQACRIMGRTLSQSFDLAVEAIIDGNFCKVYGFLNRGEVRINDVDRFKKTLLDYALQSDQSEIVEMLKYLSSEY